MSETTTKKRGGFGNVLLQAASILFGWILLSCVNLVPDVMCMPLVRAVRDYDPYASIVDYEFAPGAFREYIAQDGNLLAGGQMIHTSDEAYYMLDGAMVTFDLENKGTKTKYTGAVAEVAPNFCDGKYFISAEYTNFIGVGKMGKGSVSLQDCSWTIDPAATEDWRRDIYDLLVRSDIDGLPAREMLR